MLTVELFGKNRNSNEVTPIAFSTLEINNRETGKIMYGFY
jgi:hypothetical protein